jgi:hypothetical protein
MSEIENRPQTGTRVAFIHGRWMEFAGRPHFPGAPGWEEVADYAIDWAEKQMATQPAP